MTLTRRINTLAATLILYLAFTTSCTNDNDLPPTPFDNADPSIGGIMYDKFWASESGFDQNDSNWDVFNDNANFFRCKQCHAWDGLGNTGSYIGRAPKTTRPNVTGLNLYEMAQEHSATELFEAMKESNGRRDVAYDLSQYDPDNNKTEGDKMPNYGEILSDAQIWDIVKFLKEGMLDVNEFYDGTYTGTYPTGSAAYSNWGLSTGDAINGNVYYSANCAGCHGDDGLQILLGDKGVGGFTRSKSYEVQHKVKFGHLGSSMVGEFDITQEDMRDLYKALADEMDFPNKRPVSYAGNIQPIWDTKGCMNCHDTGGSVPELTPLVSYNNIVPAHVDLNNPAQSRILTVLGGFMRGSITTSDEALILKWIEEGALDN